MNLAQTIFIDHNEISNLYDNRHDIKKNLEETLIILDGKNIKIVLSIFSLYEISKCAEDKSRKICSILEKFNPYYMWLPFDIQLAEIKRFISKKVYSEKLAPTANSLTDFNRIANNSNLIVTDALSQIILSLKKNPNPYNFQLKELMKSRRITKDNYDIKNTKQQKKLFRQRIIDFIQELNKQNQPEKFSEEHVVYCENNKNDLLKRCPAILLEELLFQKMYGDKGRQLKCSDAPDIMYMISGGSYCDYFVTSDGFMKDCLKYCISKSKDYNVKLAQVKLLSDFI